MDVFKSKGHRDVAVCATKYQTVKFVLRKYTEETNIILRINNITILLDLLRVIYSRDI